MAKIDIGDTQVEIPMEDMWATEATQRRIEHLLQMEAKKSTRKKYKDLFGDVNDPKSLTGGVATASKQFGKITKTVSAQETVYQAATEAATGFVDSILKSTGRLNDANSMIGGFTNAIAGVSALAGPAGIAFAAITKFAGAVDQTALDYLSTLSPSLYQLTQAGFDAETSIVDLDMRAREARMSIEELTGSVLESRVGLLRFGQGLDQGVEYFRSAIDEISTANDYQMERLGIGLEDIIASTQSVIEMNRRTGLLSGQDLATVTTQLVKNYRILGELTGASIDEQREAMMDELRDQRFMARILQLRQEGRTEEAKVLLQMVSSARTVSEDYANYIKEVSSEFGDVTSAQSALFGEYFDIDGSIKQSVTDILSGRVNKDFVNQLIAGQTQMISQALNDPELLGVAQIGFVEGGGNPLSDLLERAVGDFAQFIDRDLTEELDAATKNTAELLENTKGFNQEMATLQGRLDDVFDETYANMVASADVVGVFNRALEGLELMVTGIDNLFGDDKTVLERTLGALQTISEVTIMKPTRVIIDLGEGAINSLSQDTAAKGLNNDNIIVEEMDRIAPYYKWGDGSLDLVSPPIQSNFMGGSLFPGMLSMVGEMGPELLSIGNSMGEVINNKTTSDIMGAAQGIVQALKADVGAGGDLMSGTGLSKTMSAIESSAPMLESSMSKLGQDMQQQSVDLLNRIANDNSDIKKLMTRLLPKAMSGNGYF